MHILPCSKYFLYFFLESIRLKQIKSKKAESYNNCYKKDLKIPAARATACSARKIVGVKRQKIILENLKRVPHNYVKEKISEIEESVRIISNLLLELEK